MIETIPSRDNYVDLDPEARDVYGLPAPRIHFVNGPNERAMIRHMFETADELLHAAGADPIWRAEGPPGETTRGAYSRALAQPRTGRRIDNHGVATAALRSRRASGRLWLVRCGEAISSRHGL